MNRVAYGLAVIALMAGATACHHSPTSGSANNPSPSASGFFDSFWMPSEGAQSGRLSRVLSIRPEQQVELGRIEGPAVVRRMWITVQSQIPQIHGLLTLRIWWDDEEEPSVEVPLGDFFGVGFGREREMKSLMAESFPAGGENHAALLCYWPMPFRKSARISIENRSLRPVSMFFIHADYEQVASLPEDTYYFHAQWRRENPVRLHVPYTILEAEGRGRYAGTVLNYRLLGPGAWVEGGDDFYIDGAQKPTLPGTGAEDYFGQAWGFRHENNALTHGTSFGPDDGRMTAYRWHVFEPIRFEKSLRVTMRCHGWDVQARQDDYSSVAFWYQTEPHKPFPPLPPVDYDYLEVEDSWRIPAAAALSALPLPPMPPGRNLVGEIQRWTASGSYDAETTGDKALDGDIETKWCDAEHPGGQWLALDFGHKRSLTGFVLKSPSTSGEPEGFDTNAFRVETSDSLDGPWTTQAKVDNENAPTNPEFRKALNVVSFSSPVAARCVRLVITNACALDSIARIQEFEVYGE